MTTKVAAKTRPDCDKSGLCGWCFVPIPPEAECFCSDVCYAACNTDLFGDASGKRLARELDVAFTKVQRRRQSGPWFCNKCGGTKVARRDQLCSICAPRLDVPSSLSE